MTDTCTTEDIFIGLVQNIISTDDILDTINYIVGNESQYEFSYKKWVNTYIYCISELLNIILHATASSDTINSNIINLDSINLEEIQSLKDKIDNDELYLLSKILKKFNDDQNQRFRSESCYCNYVTV
jgi:hypothetical protein